MNELALFAGAGGGILAAGLLGRRVVCAVEREPYRREILMRRQEEGFIPPFPIWSDVETFNGKPWRGAVDIVSAGFPCQDISIAGDGAGIDGERSGQWRNVVRIVREVQPARIDLENSPLLVSRGLARVLGDLAALGFDARWGRYGGAGFGAPADGKRFWLVAHSTDRARLERAERRGVSGEVWQPQPGRLPWWDTEPGVFRVGDGVAYRVDRLSAVGDGQFPAVAARAFHELGRQPSRAVDY